MSSQPSLITRRHRICPATANVALGVFLVLTVAMSTVQGVSAPGNVDNLITHPHYPSSEDPHSMSRSNSARVSASRLLLAAASAKEVDTSHPETGDKCDLMGTFGQWVQVIGGFLAFGALVLRWYWEDPARPTIIWAMDSTRNCLAQVTAHFMSVYVAFLVSAEAPISVPPCSWYLVIFLADVSIGVSLAYLFLQLSQRILLKLGFTKYARSGDYGQVVEGSTGELIKEPNTNIFITQCAIWVVGCVVPSRILCATVIYSLKEPLAKFTYYFSLLFKNHPHVELVVVLFCGPVLLNALQFFVQDRFLSLSMTRTSSSSSQGAMMLGNMSEGGGIIHLNKMGGTSPMSASKLQERKAERKLRKERRRQRQAGEMQATGSHRKQAGEFAADAEWDVDGNDDDDKHVYMKDAHGNRVFPDLESGGLNVGCSSVPKPKAGSNGSNGNGRGGGTGSTSTSSSASSLSESYLRHSYQSEDSESGLTDDHDDNGGIYGSSGYAAELEPVFRTDSLLQDEVVMGRVPSSLSSAAAISKYQQQQQASASKTKSGAPHGRTSR